MDALETPVKRLAEGDVAGDGQNEDSPLGHDERQPDVVVKPFHSSFSAPQRLLQIDNAVIIPKTASVMQGKFPRPFVTLCC